jgi:CBS-domain-containing membrane protein
MNEAGREGSVFAMLNVRDVMSQSVISVDPAMPLKKVARLLVDHRISGLPVVGPDGEVLGVISEADFLVKVQGPDAVSHRPLARIFGESRESTAQLAKLAALTAGGAMSSPAVTIEANGRIRDAAALMTARRVNRLPVVEDGRLVGILTRADLVRAYVRSDDELARTIREDVLVRILWLDPARFEVGVTNGVATIRGQAERRSTAEMVGRVVAMVPGIVDVLDSVTWERDDSEIQPATRDMVFPFGPR